jgi:serine protease inhibitor
MLKCTGHRKGQNHKLIYHIAVGTLQFPKNPGSIAEQINKWVGNEGNDRREEGD